MVVRNALPQNPREVGHGKMQKQSPFVTWNKTYLWSTL